MGWGLAPCWPPCCWALLALLALALALPLLRLLLTPLLLVAAGGTREVCWDAAKLTGACGGRGGRGTDGSDGAAGGRLPPPPPPPPPPKTAPAGARMGVVMGPLPSGLTPPGESARGACRVSELGSKPPPGELRANEHCVLQMLSLLTASCPNSKMSCGQLLILSDWHCAPSLVQVQLVQGEILEEEPSTMLMPLTRHWVTSSRQWLRSMSGREWQGTRGLLKGDLEKVQDYVQYLVD